MKGVTEGETREGKVKVSDSASNEELAGKEVSASFKVVEVYKHENPPLTPEFLEELGDFESEDELRSFIRDSLQRQADYREQQIVREKVVELLDRFRQFRAADKHSFVAKPIVNSSERSSNFAETDSTKIVFVGS